MAETTTEPKKSSKKLMLFIILGAAAATAAGGAGYYFYASREAGDPKKQERGKTAEKEQNAKESGEKVETVYYDLGKPLVVNVGDSASVRFVQVSLSFLAEGEDTAEALKKNEPMIRNNLLLLINSKDVENLKTKEGKEKLRAEILKEVAGILKKMAGGSGLREVYFTSFVMQ